MNKVLLIGGMCLALSLSACQHAPTQRDTVISQQQIQQIQHDFQTHAIDGVMTIYNGQSFANFGSDVDRATQQYIPASTFKILNALIGLEHGKVTSSEVFKWDGQKRSFPAWEKDMTLAQAMQASAVPVYQELARRIGLPLMASEVKRVGYGNQNIGTQVDNFWLVGPLTISPEQEAKFAYQLANQQLAFSKNVQQQVQQMILIEEKQGYKLYAKSGWGMDVEPMVGWYTGWVEQPNGKVQAFSLNMTMQKDSSPKTRQTLTISTLKTLKLLPENF
ncbi:class D beta-lactamase [Acinetobacter puyangensis]|uniref:class D beta-lactamase n=1 Tax=Acinetobacter puyangensis TaxID=1096779 RepID=UPI003A4E4C7A